MAPPQEEGVRPTSSPFWSRRRPRETKKLLLQRVRAAGYKPVFAVLVEALGKDDPDSEICRLAPDHCFFNPIELAWADLEKYMKKHNDKPDKPDTVGAHIVDALVRGGQEATHRTRRIQE